MGDERAGKLPLMLLRVWAWLEPGELSGREALGPGDMRVRGAEP